VTTTTFITRTAIIRIVAAVVALSLALGSGSLAYLLTSSPVDAVVHESVTASTEVDPEDVSGSSAGHHADQGLETRQGDDIHVLHRYGERARSAGTTDWRSMYEFLEFVIRDVDAVWSHMFDSWGYHEPFVRYAFPVSGQGVHSACNGGFITNDASAFYCPADDTIVISQALARSVWSGTMVGPDGQRLSGPGGDFAVAFIVAHEVAHSIQAELGIRVSTVRMELHADCWAGVWANSAYHRNLLDPGDIREGLAAAWLVGDSNFDSADHHGTSKQRMDAFTHGYNTGRAAACDGYLG
jgi:predicted metalloprotease